ncbi:MAG: hypothetical protein HY819_16440 [Acidobacteria bacterium]|nr:hypothetical protein [Acidobacteriota bacterium]
MYLLEFATYITGIAHGLPFLVCGALSLFSIYLIRQQGFPWAGLLAWIGLSSWLMAMQCLVVVYGAGNWYGDWYEHYERSVFFLNQLPLETKFLNNLWTLPARGPIFNASSALVMAGLGDEFWIFQIISTVFNSFTFLPLALLIRDIAKIRETIALLISTIICGLAPFAIQPELCTWTKFFTVAFILSGFYFYRLGAVEKKPWLMGGSFIVFATGILAHYLAVIYTFFFACHFLYLTIKNRWNWQVIVYPAIISALLLFSWFGFCVATFGFKATTMANSTLGDYKDQIEQSETTNEPSAKPSASLIFLANVVSTTVPYSWRRNFKFAGTPTFFPQLDEESEYLYGLANNSASFLGALGWSGSIGLLVAVYLALRKTLNINKLGEPYSPEFLNLVPGRYFWLIYFLLGIPLNIMVHTTYAIQGLVVIHLQTYICLIAIFLISNLSPLNLLPKLAFILIFLVESALAVFATLALQARKLPVIIEANGNIKAEAEVIASPVYVGNYIYKLSTKAVFISDKFADIALPISIGACLLAISMFFVGLIYSYKATMSNKLEPDNKTDSK